LAAFDAGEQDNENEKKFVVTFIRAGHDDRRQRDGHGDDWVDQFAGHGLVDDLILQENPKRINNKNG
jgi:hypothetical protein